MLLTAPVTILYGIAGLVSATPSPPADALLTMTAQPVMLSGRGQTAPAQTTTQTGDRDSQQMVKSTPCLKRTLFGMDTRAAVDSSSYAKHVSIEIILKTKLLCKIKSQ